MASTYAPAAEIDLNKRRDKRAESLQIIDDTIAGVFHRKWGHLDPQWTIPSPEPDDTTISTRKWKYLLQQRRHLRQLLLF